MCISTGIDHSQNDYLFNNSYGNYMYTTHALGTSQNLILYVHIHANMINIYFAADVNYQTTNTALDIAPYFQPKQNYMY